MNEEIYDMRLHQEFSPTNKLRIMRVPGGWLYTIRHEDPMGSVKDPAQYTTTFVRYHNEFQPCD